MKKFKRSAAGFTLIELLITMVIICILATVAYASYRQHIIKVRRNNAAISLTDLAAQLENYYNQNHTYEKATINGLGVKNNDGFYHLEITSASENSYQLSAIPLKSQATNDTKCGTLGLDYLGNKFISGSGKISDCWL
jgi:type IV pilus assembly protein PilE